METTTNKTLSSQELMELENQHGAHNYHPLGVVLAKGEGVYVWDVEGKQYFDFLSAYSAVNQGHCHPRLVAAITEQASVLNLTSRAFYNDKLGVFEKFATEYFGYEKLLPNFKIQTITNCRPFFHKIIFFSLIVIYFF